MKASNFFYRSIAGSTIVETVVSMTILLTILTLFFTQIGKIDNASNPHSIYFAYELTEKLYNSNDILIELTDTIKYKRFIIEKKIIPAQPGLYFVEIIIKSESEREIYKRSKWISDSIEL